MREFSSITVGAVFDGLDGVALEKEGADHGLPRTHLLHRADGVGVGMMELDRNLLNSGSEHWDFPQELYAQGKARGSYSPTQYVVRMHPNLQAALDGIPDGAHPSGQFSTDALSAYSTYIHETIHWWQHIGSTSGLLLSFCLPMQAHINYGRLKQLLTAIGPCKSLRQFNAHRASAFSKEVNDNLHIVLNNWHDIEFCKRLMLEPDSAESLISDPYFESVGHSYYIAQSRFLRLISQTIDPAFEILPDPRHWEEAFQDFKKQKVSGFYYGSEIRLPPIGARAIFEGQARFSQLQYLHFASSGGQDWPEFERLGMLWGIYIKAFEVFLRILGENRPNSVDHPLVGLFLLLCDLSINPTEGFPFDIASFNSLIHDIDPGLRFYVLCLIVRDKHTRLKAAITSYSREQYIQVSETLSQETFSPSPLQAAAKIASWSDRSEKVREILKEDELWTFSREDLPVRIFLSRFIRFQTDKLSCPELFTWPGVWTTETNSRRPNWNTIYAMFRNHEPLFLEAPDGEVRPRLLADRSEQALQKTFNDFYAWNANYNLVHQWQVEKGAFNLDFGWLTRRYSQAEMNSWAETIFKGSFGYALSDFVIL